MPVAAEQALHVAAAKDSFAVADLVGLDANSRLVLARRLVREGFARTSRGQP